jgi:transcriptional accessory protein Tex/SPT6
MIAPGTLTMRDLEEGMIVPGRVTRLERYGAFVDIGVGRDGMLHVKEMGRGYVEKPEDVVRVGDEIQVEVVGVDHRRGRIDLSMKNLLPEPEPVPVVEVMQVSKAAAEPFFDSSEDDFVSPFELAFREASTKDRADRKRERRKKPRPWEYEEDEDDLIARTLAHHRKNV